MEASSRWQASNLKAMTAQLEEGGWLTGWHRAQIKHVKLPLRVAEAGDGLQVDERTPHHYQLHPGS